MAMQSHHLGDRLPIAFVAASVLGRLMDGNGMLVGLLSIEFRLID